MEELLKKIQKKQNQLIEQYHIEQSNEKKETIRKQLYLLCNDYIKISKKLRIED